MPSPSMSPPGREAATLVPSLPGASLWLLTVGGLWFCLWRRRWRLAGLPVVAVGAAAGTARRRPTC
mgnify:CR=1 FL=1